MKNSPLFSLRIRVIMRASQLFLASWRASLYRRQVRKMVLLIPWFWLRKVSWKRSHWWMSRQRSLSSSLSPLSNRQTSSKRSLLSRFKMRRRMLKRDRGHGRKKRRAPRLRLWGGSRRWVQLILWPEAMVLNLKRSKRSREPLPHSSRARRRSKHR